MNKRRNKRGFTMAELLIVVAIIAVLTGVSFVAVAQHQRSLERLERDSVAREIFVAAQNHLTMAESQGFLGLAEQCGETEDADQGIYYFVVNGDLKDPAESLADLMLPFGAIDETVRMGGSYIIRYQKSTDRAIIPATVMDVFYCSSPATDSRFGYTLSKGDEAELVERWREGADRKNFKGKVLGWYGGAAAEALTRKELADPLLFVENGDKLRVGVKDQTDGGSGSLQIIVRGVTSGVQMVYDLKKSTQPGFAPDATRLDTANAIVDGETCDFVIILDDITAADLHFADLTGTKDGATAQFIPGEDIVIQAIAFDNTQISNIAYSAEKTTNSLYEKLETAQVDGTGIMTASVNNMRHLENLHPSVSNVATTREEGEGAARASYTLGSAVQTSDMDWNAFKAATGGDNTSVYQHSPSEGDSTHTEAACYLPVSPGYTLAYDGQGHSISNVKVNHAGDAGLFGALTGSGNAADPTAVKNLALIDFDVAASGSGNAGALAGTLSNVTVSNVVAYDLKKDGPGVRSGAGDAGGLVGGFSSSSTGCVIEKSAASVAVASATGNAGGLVASSSGGRITGCYAGGHTDSGAYFEHNADGTLKTDADGKPTPIYNVTAAGNAGGLVASAVSTPIENSYSTCSVTGATAGGLVGTANGSISNCYATGLVSGTASEGAFAAQAVAGSLSGCHFYDIVNERPAVDAGGNETDGFDCLPALGNVKGPYSDAAIAAIDATVETYEAFVGSPDDAWLAAIAYDDALVKYYDGKYPLQTVAQLGATLQAEVRDANGNVTTPADFVATHYGDWPAPEIFAINEAG